MSTLWNGGKGKSGLLKWPKREGGPLLEFPLWAGSRLAE